MAHTRHRDDDPGFRAVNRHYVFEFEPRFRQTDCIIRFTIEIPPLVTIEIPPWPEPDLLTTLYYAAFDYLVANDPVAAAFIYQFHTRSANVAEMYIMFFDDCDRRETVGETLLKAWADSHPELELTLDTGPYEPGVRTIRGGGNWLDAAEYNPRYWQLRKRAHRGDTNALLALAKAFEGDELGHPNTEVAFIYYYLASRRLVDARDLVFADHGMAANLAEVAPARREALRATAREWDAAIRGYGEGDPYCDADGRRE